MNNKKSPLRERAESRIRRGKIGLEELSGAEMEELLQELQVHQVELEMQNEELKRTQDSLESSRDRYAALYHAAPIGFCSLDNLGHVIEMNHTFITILEVSKEALVNRTLLKHIHEEDLGIYFHLMKQKEHHSQTRLRMYTVDKQVRVVDMTSVRIGFDQEERLLLAEDVTEAQKRELELNKRSNVLDQTMDGVVITDSGNRVSYVNPAFEKTTGYCREDVVGRNPSILSSSQHDKRFYMEMWKHIKQKGHWRGEIWNKRKNGEIYPELLTVTAIKNDYGQLESYVGVFSDISKWKETEMELEEREEFLRRLLESAGEGIFGMDSLRQTTFVNPAFTRMLGYTFEDVQGKSLHQMIHHSYVDGMEYSVNDCPVCQTLRDGRSRQVHDEVFWKKSGESFPVAYSCTPIKRKKEVEGVVVIFNDISVRKKTEEALHRAKRQAEESARAKEEFLASMSHELRTPLTSIIGNAELTMERVTDPEVKELVHSIMVAGRSQLSLVNDILDVSKIDSGKFTIESRPYDFTILIHDMEQLFTRVADDAGLHFHIEQRNHEAYLLLGDGQRIGQILINLIGNAIKFTEEGEVLLTTDVADEHLIFEVRDTGIGMPSGVIDTLFNRFEQADRSISRRYGGSGLGLYISMSLARLMGGNIEVSSRENSGSLFRLILPYQRSTHLTEGAKGESGGDPSHQIKLNGHVLVAEDTLAIQQLEKRMLEKMGLTVTTVNNGREAIEQATEGRFDLILMDMQMPELDGIEATKLLRVEGNRIPIIALTANVMAKHRELFAEAGCDDFVAKPIDRKELGAVLQKFLGN